MPHCMALFLNKQKKKKKKKKKKERKKEQLFTARTVWNDSLVWPVSVRSGNYTTQIMTEDRGKSGRGKPDLTSNKMFPQIR